MNQNEVVLHTNESDDSFIGDEKDLEQLNVSLLDYN